MKFIIEFNSLDEISELQKLSVLGDNKVQDIIGDTALQVSEAMLNAEKKTKGEPKIEAKKSEPAPEKKEEPKKEPAKEEKAAGESKVDESTIRILLSEKLKKGKKDAVKELFGKYGVEKMSELVAKYPDKLDDFYKEAEAL